jgi:DNA polymerase-3 subunit alpha
MPAPRFVHLRLHSEYSVSDGIVRIEQAVERAVADAMPALALTDLANLFGMMKFYRAARAAGIKPIVGADCWLRNDADRAKPFRILLLCASRAGYRRLCELLTRAWLQNRHRGRGEIAAAWFDELGTEGLVALSGFGAGDVGQALAAGNERAAQALAAAWARRFPGRYYLELQRAGAPQTDALVARTLALAARAGLPVVATHPVQFLAPEDFKAHEARVCIAEGTMLGDRRRPRLFTPEQYFKSQEEMATLFADVPQALENAVEIARRCNLEIELGRTHLPAFPTPGGIGVDAYLREQAEAGLEARLAQLYPDRARRAAERARYRARLEFEISTIVKMGFAGYFLIVADFIGWARANGIPVGPGRGSGAGSLVAYALGITGLDPLRYELLFERFLNPERVSLPDFDIDFCQEGRDRVIEYVRAKYGPESVAQIATFGTLAARAVVRDVGRVLDLGYGFCDQIAKLIPFQPGRPITLREAREMEPLLAERERNEEEVRDLLALAEKLEGLVRNVGMHAGGVLIAPRKLTDFCPLYAAEGTAHVVSQFDKDDVEKAGLVKFDFLGLTTLTILDRASCDVRRLGHPEFSLETIPLDDAETYRLLASGNTTAVFQLESRGMRDLLKRARPDRFEDVIALVALYRPGPMDLIPDFIRRKHGEERVEYLDPRLEPILAPTYGIMVYQEQVMQIAQAVAGYTLGGADLLRRAMGKKDAEEMAKQRAVFVAGAERNGMARAKAVQLFNLMEKFAGYGFNKSHAAAYALLAYQTAYMKRHHPAAFMAANLSAVMDDTDKVHQLYDEALACGLRVLPPDINASEYRFVPVDAGTLRYGLGAVRGTGESAVAAIVSARSGGAFADLFDFCRRVDRRTVNRRAIEALVRAGAFDRLDANRARLLASVGRALEAAERAERAAAQASLFGETERAQETALARVEAEPWDLERTLAEEKAALGFCLSAHPFSVHARALEGFPRTPIAKLGAAERAWIAGVAASVRVQMTRRGRMVALVLDDGTGQVEVSVFNELYEQQRDRVKQDALLVVAGRVQRDELAGASRVVAEELYDLAALRERFGVRLRISMNGPAREPGAAARLRDALAPYRVAGRGGCAVVVHYQNGVGSCDLALGDGWRVRPDARLIGALSAWLAPENVTVEYARGAS